MHNVSLWVEKYRPQVIADCVLPEDLKTNFQKFLETQDIPNMILTGKPGMGKTTVAKALCREMGCDTMVINASDESGIDVLREKIKTFATTVSLMGGLKVVILDEADHLNPQSTQPALRNFMEEFSHNCRFILTCNYRRKIIEPLISRCTVFEFQISSTDKQKIAAAMMKRISHILKDNSIEFDPKVVAQVIMKFFPDFRKTISEFQRYSLQHGSINVGILADIHDVSVKELMGCMKDRNFPKMRAWVNENLDGEPTEIIRQIFDSLEDNLEPSSVPQAILILADYAYKAAFVSDQELHLSAMLIQIMADCVFKK